MRTLSENYPNLWVPTAQLAETLNIIMITNKRKIQVLRPLKNSLQNSELPNRNDNKDQNLRNVKEYIDILL